MNDTPKEKSSKELLGPSSISAAGFLGTDSRSLEEIVAADAAALELLGTSKEDLLAALRDAHDKARKALGASVRVSKGATGVHNDARGALPCPFLCGVSFQKGETEIAGAAGGKSFIITPLSLHLIDRHGFFQGLNSRYRIDPALAAALLLP